jgi:hypothetical protein
MRRQEGRWMIGVDRFGRPGPGQRLDQSGSLAGLAQ